jgi:predicted MPP superfamily phosphohydrolase
MLALCAVAGMLAGAGTALFITNRWLLHLVDGRLKLVIMVATALVLTLGPALAGALFPTRGTLVAFLLVLAAFAAGEARRAYLRRGARADGPLETSRFLGQGEGAGPFTTTALTVLRYEVTAPSLPLPRLRIAHISDLHISPALPLDYYRAAMACVKDARPDVLLMTGDFVSKASALPLLRQILPGVSELARFGAFAVLGNHDYWADAHGVDAALREVGVVRLHDQVVTLPLGPGLRVKLAGDERPWGPGSAWREQQSADDLTVVLTHTADNIYRLRQGGAALVFAGHYHAGQIRLPWLGSLVVPSAFGRLFDHGHFLLGRTHLFVTAGIGAGSPAFRICCPPDVLVVDLVRDSRDSSSRRPVAG